MSRGWLLSDWYRVKARAYRTLEAADDIAALGFKVCLPPLSHGLDVLLVKFDIWEDEWWRIAKLRHVAGFYEDGWVKWPVAIPNKTIQAIRAELSHEREAYLGKSGKPKVGRAGLPNSTEFTVYRPAVLRLCSHTSPIQSAMLRKRLARQASQPLDTIS